MIALALVTPFIGLIASLWLTQPAAPQETPPPPDPAAAPSAPAPVRSSGPLAWEDLPQSLQDRLDALVGKPLPQAVLTADAPASVDADFRRIDHGSILSEQIVRPAAWVAITRPARNTRKYGPVGALLWQGVRDAGDWWCWRDTARFPDWVRPPNIYCYRDADGDGDFDAVMENAGAGGHLMDSRFQFRDMGREENLRDVVAYEAGATPADPQAFAEKVVIRYDGPGFARVAPDGRLVEGVVLFDLLTGAGIATPARPARGNALVQILPEGPDDGLNEIDKLVVRLDAEGKGRLDDPRGIVIEVERVDLDGSARVRLVSGLPAGRALLFPAPTRETFLEMISDMLGRRAGPSAPSSEPPPASDSGRD